ncbi:hypothetical protein GCM10023075_78370 [Streptosporangium album]
MWRFLIGPPLRVREVSKEQITPAEGLSALSLDALTSVAYGPEACRGRGREVGRPRRVSRVRRHIAFERLHNFRDLGGYRTEDGRTVRWGRLYRSDSLSKLRGEDWSRFLDLGVRTVIDLRYPWEIAAKGRVPHDDGLAYHNLSIEHRPYDQAGLSSDIETARFLADRYAEVALDGVGELRQALEVIASDDSAPLVIHCASGKDRTGMLAALVLSLLGVDEDTVIADFALTGLATDRLIADWHAVNPGRTLTWPGYGQAPAEIMRLFLADLAIDHGSVRDYAVTQLGVDDELIVALRGHLLSA